MKTHSRIIAPETLEVDPERGFLPSQDPLQRLPRAFDTWEHVAQSLPKLLVTDRVRYFLNRLPDFPSDELAGDGEVRRAMLLLSYLGHAYIWGEETPADRLPARTPPYSLGES